MQSRGLTRKSLAAPLILVTLFAVGSFAPAQALDTPTCLGTQLSGKTTGEGAGMSQPYSVITVTNTSSSPCSLKGYPVLTGASSAIGKVDISVNNGALFNLPSAKITSFVLAPKAKAWFALGSATAYTGPLVTITRITFAAQKGASVAESSILKQELQANGPIGKPIPLGVTAFAPGKGPGGVQ